MALQGQPSELRWVVYFTELEKGLVLNSTNAQIIAGFLKSDETDEWRGHKVVLYSDPNISYGGRVTGGIRVRAPKAKPQAIAAAPAVAQPPVNPAAAFNPGEEEDNCPF